MDIDRIKSKLKDMLSEEKYDHSISVMETARKLAKRYGEDQEKAALAGLLHDCAKNLSEDETLSLIEKYGIVMDPISEKTSGLLHGHIGAYLVRDIFGINDPQILSAVSVHTMGCENMDKLGCIVFIADYTEEGRDFPNVEEVREAAEESLEKAVVARTDAAIKHLLAKGKPIHPQTVATRNWALERLNALDSP